MHTRSCQGCICTSNRSACSVSPPCGSRLPSCLSGSSCRDGEEARALMRFFKCHFPRWRRSRSAEGSARRGWAPASPGAREPRSAGSGPGPGAGSSGAALPCPQGTGSNTGRSEAIPTCLQHSNERCLPKVLRLAAGFSKHWSKLFLLLKLL